MFDVLKTFLWKKTMSKELKERKKETEHFKKEISLLQSWGTIKYFPVMFFAEGISTYDLGFDVASIYYSSLSVEFSLLIRVNQEIGNNIQKFSKEKLRQLKSLKGLIKTAHELRILDGQHKNLANKIRKLRNCYVHYYNLLYFSFQEIRNLGITFQEHRAEIEQLKEKFPWLQQWVEVTDKFASFPLPDISWAIGKEAIEFMKERTEEYNKWLLQQGVTPALYAKNLEKIGREPVIFRYDRKRCDAYNMLEWSLKILKYTRFVV